MSSHEERDSAWLPAYDTRFRFPIPPPQTKIDDTPTRCIVINEQWLAHIDGVIERLLWTDAWGGSQSDKSRAVNEIIRMLRSIDECTPAQSQNIEVIIDERTCVIVDKEDYERMTRLSIERTATGSVYLLEDCGCGKYNRYTLTPVSEETTTPNPADSQSAVVPGTLIVAGPYQSCYREKAAKLIVQRMKDWFSRIADVVNIGIDVFSPDEYLDAAGELIDLVRNANQWDDIRDTSKDAFNDLVDGYESAIAAEIPPQPPVSRSDLKSMVNAVFPIVDGVVPIRAIVYRWSEYANVRSLNAGLSLISTECQTGTNLPASGQVFTVGNYRARIMSYYVPINADYTIEVSGKGLATFGIWLNVGATGNGTGTLFVAKATLQSDSGGQTLPSDDYQFASYGSGTGQGGKYARVGWGNEDAVYESFEDTAIKAVGHFAAQASNQFSSSPNSANYTLSMTVEPRLTGWDMVLRSFVVVEHVI